MLVAFVGFEASSVIVVVTVLEPLWRDFIYQVSYLAVVVPVLTSKYSDFPINATNEREGRAADDSPTQD